MIYMLSFYIKITIRYLIYLRYLIFLLLAGCKLGEIDIDAPAYSCTTDGYKVDAQGVIIVDQTGLAVDCLPQ